MGGHRGLRCAGKVASMTVSHIGRRDVGEHVGHDRGRERQPMRRKAQRALRKRGEIGRQSGRMAAGTLTLVRPFPRELVRDVGPHGGDVPGHGGVEVEVTVEQLQIHILVPSQLPGGAHGWSEDLCYGALGEGIIAAHLHGDRVGEEEIVEIEGLVVQVVGKDGDMFLELRLCRLPWVGCRIRCDE